MASYTSVLRSFISSISLLQTGIREEYRSSGDAVAVRRADVEAISIQLSNILPKFYFAFIDEPAVEDCAPFSDLTFQAAAAVVALYQNECGNSVSLQKRKQWKDCVEGILSALVDFANEMILESGPSSEAAVRERKAQMMRSQFAIARDRVEALKTLPLSNCEALARCMKASAELVGDAASEMEEMMNEAPSEDDDGGGEVDRNGDSDDIRTSLEEMEMMMMGASLSVEERRVLPGGIKLLKACSTFLARFATMLLSVNERNAIDVGGDDGSMGSVSWFNRASEKIQGIAAQADEFGSSVYPPQDIRGVIAEGVDLEKRVLEAMNQLKELPLTEKEQRLFTVVETVMSQGMGLLKDLGRETS